MPDNESQDRRGQMRDAMHEMLIDKIGEDRYPSATMMDLVEAGVDERLLPKYVDVLMTKLGETQYPSTDMLKRLANLL